LKRISSVSFFRTKVKLKGGRRNIKKSDVMDREVKFTANMIFNQFLRVFYLLRSEFAFKIGEKRAVCIFLIRDCVSFIDLY
jgi:hypothetical protein